MKVMVDNKLTYEAPFPVEVGDLLVLPPTPWKDGPYIGTVTSLTSNYNGYLKRALRNLGGAIEQAEAEVARLETLAKETRRDLKEARTKLATLRTEQ